MYKHTAYHQTQVGIVRKTIRQVVDTGAEKNVRARGLLQAFHGRNEQQSQR